MATGSSRPPRAHLLSQGWKQTRPQMLASGLRSRCRREGFVEALLADEADEPGHVHRRRAGVGALGREHAGADAGFAVVVADVGLELVAEVADVAEHRVGRRLAEAAEGGVLDGLAEFDERLDVAFLALAVADAGDDLEHALGADAAGRALAAALLLGELQEEAGHVDHAAVLVHDDEAARAHDGAQFDDRLVVHRHVEVLAGDGAAGRTAQLSRLVRLAAGDAAGDVVDDVAQRDAHVDFDEADVVDLAGEGEDLGARALLGAGGAEPVGAEADDAGDAGQGLDVVEHRRLLPQALLSRERRPRARLAALALDGGHERGLFAADEGAGTLGDLDVEVEAAVEDVLAQQAVFVAGRDGQVEALQSQRILGAAVDVAFVGADGAGPDHHAFEHGVRVALDDGPVHERAGVALVGVAEDVLLVALGLGGELPLEAGGEAGAAAAAQAALLDLGHDVRGGHLGEGFGQAGVTVAGDVLVDALRRDPALVAQHAQVLPGEERDVLEQRDAVLGDRMLVHQPLDRAALDDVFGHDLGGVLGR